MSAVGNKLSQDTIAAEVRRHLMSIQAAAALGAALRLRQEGLEAHPALRQHLDGAVSAIHPDLPDGLTPEHAQTMLAGISFTLREAADLLADPARQPGWRHEDPMLIQSIGQTSRRVVHEVEAATATHPALQEALRQPGGAFLDVGTGAGWLAIEAARTWPALRVVGVDVWEPSLTLARANLAAAGLQDRVELRRQDVTAFHDKDAYVLAWLPLMFLPEEVARAAVKRLHGALVPGGWLVAGRIPSPPHPLGAALSALRTVRGGGHPWTDVDLEQLIRATGFHLVGHMPTAQVTLTFAQR
jgi:SAM-dependent methyltransferase